MSKGRRDLLSAGSATGEWFGWYGGHGIFIAEAGAWGDAAAAALEVKTPSGGAVVVAGTQLTEDGATNFILPPGEIRVRVDGTVTTLSSWAVHISP